jgi:hypothetical protein
VPPQRLPRQALSLPVEQQPSSIRRTDSASETPSSLALAFSARSCSSLMYNCFLTIYTSFTSQGAIAARVPPASKPPPSARPTQRSSRSRSRRAGCPSKNLLKEFDRSV